MESDLIFINKRMKNMKVNGKMEIVMVEEHIFIVFFLKKYRFGR
jgi:hypothetical protein